MWVVYAAIWMGWEILSIIVRCGGSLGIDILFRLIFTVALYAFEIWVVRVHIEEIERAGGPPAYTSQNPYPDKA